jgi:hypothetical protein
LTNDERPYREAFGPYDTLDEIIGKDVKSEKYSSEIYYDFVRSSGMMARQENLRTSYPLDEKAHQTHA